MRKLFAALMILLVLDASAQEFSLELMRNGREYKPNFSTMPKTVKAFTTNYLFEADGARAKIRVFNPKFLSELDVCSRPVTYVAIESDDDFVSKLKATGTDRVIGPLTKDKAEVFMIVRKEVDAVKEGGKVLVDWWRANGKSYPELIRDADFAYRRLRAKADEFEEKFRGDQTEYLKQFEGKRLVKGLDGKPYFYAKDGSKKLVKYVIEEVKNLRHRRKGYKEPFQCEYTDRVKKMPQMKGAMLTDRDVPEEDVKTLAGWGATLMRYQIAYFKPNKTQYGIWSDEKLCEEYLKWIDTKIPNIIQVLKWAEKYDFYVLLDLHDVPGGRVTQDEAKTGNGWHDCRLFYNQKFVDCYFEAWRRIVQHTKGNRRLYGYDLINEPHQVGKNVVIDSRTLQFEAAKLLRRYDPETPVVVASQYGGGPGGWDILEPLPMKDVIYTVHTYRPYFYAFQGWNNEDIIDNTYPNPSRGLDKETLIRILDGVREFQEAYGARILCGEFSAMCTAPGAAEYIRDYIDIFNDYGWDWTYDAFREWSAWSVEHIGVRQGNGDFRFWPSEDNDRKRVLLKALSRR